MPLKNGWTGKNYSFFRALLGLSLLIYFLHLLPWGFELFSNQGALSAYGPGHHFLWFPNVLAVWDGPAAVALFLILGALLSFLLMIGSKDRLASIGLWYLWACLLDRNPSILNPQLPYIGWLLLAHASLPMAPQGSWDARFRPDLSKTWEFPQAIQEAAWWVVGLSYSYSGYFKLLTPSWKDGSALHWILQHPLSRDNFFCHALLALPPGGLMALTWMAAWLEFLCWPLALMRKARPWLWTALLLTHIALLLLMDFFW